MMLHSCRSLLGLGLALTLTTPVLVADEWDIHSVDASKLPPASSRTGLTYAKDIRPLLEASCIHCHGQERQKGGLRLDTLEATLKGGEHGDMIVPGDSKKSLIVAASAQVNDGIAMPPKRGPGGRGGAGGRGPGGRGPEGGRPRGGPGEPEGGAAQGGRPPGGGPGGPGGRGGPPAKPLTAEQVGLLRAWIDQGAK